MHNSHEDLTDDTLLLETEVFDNCFVEGFLNLNFFQIFASLCLAATCSLATPKTAQAATLVTTVSSKTVAKLVINAKREEPVSNKKVFLAKRTESMAVHAFPRPVSSKPSHLTRRNYQTLSRNLRKYRLKKRNSIRASLSKEEMLVIALRMIPNVASNLLKFSTEYGPHVSVIESAVNLAIIGTNYIKNQMQKDNQQLPPAAEDIVFTELKEVLMPLIDNANERFQKESDARLDLIAEQKKAITQESVAKVKAIEAKQKRKQELHEAKLKRIED